VEAGHRKKDLPKAPKRPKKADVLAAMGEDDEGDNEGGDCSSDESDVDEEVGGYQAGGDIEDDGEESIDDDASDGE